MNRTFEKCILETTGYKKNNITQLTEPEEWFKAPVDIQRPFTMAQDGSQKKIYAGTKLKALDIDKFHSQFMQFVDPAQTPETRGAHAQSIFQSLYEILEDIETLPVFTPKPENHALSENKNPYQSFYESEKLKNIDDLKFKYFCSYLFDSFQSKYTDAFSQDLAGDQLKKFFFQDLKFLEKIRPFIAHARLTPEKSIDDELKQFLCLIQLEELIAKLESKLVKLQANKSDKASTRLQKLITDLNEIKSKLEPGVSVEDTLGKVTNLISEAAKAPELIKSHTFLMRALLGFLSCFGWKPEKDIILDELHEDLDSSTNPFRPGR